MQSSLILDVVKVGLRQEETRFLLGAFFFDLELVKVELGSNLAFSILGDKCFKSFIMRILPNI